MNRRGKQLPGSRRLPAGAAPRPRTRTPFEPLPRAAWSLAVLVAAACVVVSVSFSLYDTDAWEHLAVGRAIWSLRTVPTTEVWTWPNFGAPNVNPSWGFSALLWPFWALGGLAGLYAWRWLTTLAAFGFAWATSRRLGASGLAPLVVLVVCALVYRQRVQIRPETLSGVLFTLAVWIMEQRRAGRPRRVLWLVPVAWVWANVHISYYLLFVPLLIHVLDAGLDRGAAASRRVLAVTLLACAAVSFLNPFGVHALARPFVFFFTWRNEPFFRSIQELGPLDWSQNWSNGLPLLLAGWPALALWRARAGRVDRVEWLTCVAFTALALTGSRFVATYALAAGPWLARGATEALAAVRPRLAPWPRTALASVACVTMCAWDWTHNVGPLGLGFDMSRAPVHACDWMATHGVRGRGMNHFAFGGYQIWRFWPDRSRLPLIDIHGEDSPPELRALYQQAMSAPDGWRALDDSLHMDYALLTRRYSDQPGVLDVVDADERWALVFVDDVAALYVRRGGPLDSLARRFAYHALGGARRTIPARLQQAAADTALAAGMRRELERQAADSPANFYGRSMARALAAAAPSSAFP